LSGEEVTQQNNESSSDGESGCEDTHQVNAPTSLNPA
jgi:hypothetical protein